MNCSIQFLQQSSVQAARGFAQGVPKTCCLNKLASDRRQACAVSKALFAVLLLALALQCSLLTRSEKNARDWPSPCPLTLAASTRQVKLGLNLSISRGQKHLNERLTPGFRCHTGAGLWLSISQRADHCRALVAVP